MSLAGGIWQLVSIHTFALEFLRAERDTFLAQLRAARPNLISDRELVDLLEKADLANPTHNQARLRLLYLMRSIYIGEIPPDTTWYEVHSLTDEDLPTYMSRVIKHGPTQQITMSCFRFLLERMKLRNHHLPIGSA